MKKIFSLLTLTLALGFAGSLVAQNLQSVPLEGTKEKPKKIEKAPQSINLTNTTANEVSPELTTLEFEEDTYEFGKITQGDVVEHEFKFTNTGEHDLKLENVKPSCGCTALEWPREAIAPGESRTIKAKFNSAGKMGKQMKYITIVYNGNPRIARIMFTGEIVPKDATADPAETK